MLKWGNQRDTKSAHAHTHTLQYFKWSRAPDARTGLFARPLQVMPATQLPPSDECVLAGNDEMEVRHIRHGSLRRIDALQPEHYSECLSALATANAREPKHLRKSSRKHTTPRKVLSA